MLKMAISAGAGRQSLAAWLGDVRLAPLPVDFVLVREADLPTGELLEACLEARRSLPAGSRVLVAGGRVDVALAAGLAGVHLGANMGANMGAATGANTNSAAGELRPEQVRKLFPEAFITVSCHSLDQVRSAQVQGVSAILFAPVFEKVVHGVQVVPGVGLEMLRAACAAAGATPVLALGGVEVANAAACLEAGAAGVAGIRLFGTASLRMGPVASTSGK